MPKLRVFLADDHAMVRTGLKILIETQSDLQVVGEAGEVPDVAILAPALAPDVAVLGFSLSGPASPGIIRQLRATCPRLRVLILSSHEDKGHIADVLAAGATGYLLKRASAEELINAIRAVARAGVYIDPRIAGKLVTPPVHPASGIQLVDLSRREAEVLRLVAQGHSHREISTQLSVSLKTIETYKARSMEKLGLRNRVDIVRHAAEAGWLHAC
jgi:DNA-binding NarL/FixJ family response regulator